MKTTALAAMLVFAVASSATAQDFNPGTVIGNVYQNPASGCGYGYGFDCYPMDYRRHAAEQAHRYARLRRHLQKDGTTEMHSRP